MLDARVDLGTAAYEADTLQSELPRRVRLIEVCVPTFVCLLSLGVCFSSIKKEQTSRGSCNIISNKKKCTSTNIPIHSNFL